MKPNNQATDQKDINNPTNGQNPMDAANCGAEGFDNMSEDSTPEDDNSSDMAGNCQPEDQQWKDKYLRLSAEFDNYRKRTLKEKMELISMGGEDVIKSLLPVLDDMDRALEAMRASEDIEAVRTGIELISHKFRDTLKSKGVKEMEAMGCELDTDLYEAVAKIPAPEECAKGKIVDVVQKGYTLNDKVIRHAKVVMGE